LFCIADESKRCDARTFSTPVEVIPMHAIRSRVNWRSSAAHPKWREGVFDRHGNVILDVHGLAIRDPVALEARIDQIVASSPTDSSQRAGADILLLGGAAGVQEYRRP